MKATYPGSVRRGNALFVRPGTEGIFEISEGAIKILIIKIGEWRRVTEPCATANRGQMIRPVIHN